VFLVNSRLRAFAASRRIAGRSYPEVTTAVLPNSLKMFLSYTLVFSTRLPVLVYGTDTLIHNNEVFLGT